MRRGIAVLALLLGVLALAILAIYQYVNLPPPEVDLPPLIVTMEDPYPCETDPLKRQAYARVGAVCSPWPDVTATSFNR